MSDNQVVTPLQNRRSARTRQRLLEAAAELTAKKGAGRFTLEDVAQRAEVHVQTLYKHFPSKNDLLGASSQMALEELESVLDERSPDEMTIDIWRAYVAKYAAQFDKSSHRFVLPGKSEAHWHINARFVEILSNNLARDMDVDPQQDRRPFLMAILLKDANDTLYMEWLGDSEKKKLAPMLLRVIDDIVEHYFVDKRPR